MSRMVKSKSTIVKSAGAVQNGDFLGNSDDILRRRKGLVKEVFSFAIPVLGSVVVDPVLTLVDTWFVGNKLPLGIAQVGLAALAVGYTPLPLTASMWMPRTGRKITIQNTKSQ